MSQQGGAAALDLAVLVAEAIRDTIVVVDAAGVILFWNAGATRTFGFSAPEAIGRDIGDLLQVTQIERRRAEQAIASGGATYDAIRRCKDGRLIHVDITSTPLPALRPEDRRTVFVIKDVTRIKVERDSRLLKNRFHGLLETIPDAIVVVNATGHVVLANQQALHLFGHHDDTLIGRRVEDLLPQPQHEAGTAAGRAAGRAMMQQDKNLYGVRADGTEFPVQVSLSSLQNEEERLVVAAIRDVTDQKKAERKFRMLLEAAPDAMVIADQAGRIVLVNSQAELMFGYDRSELLDEPIEILLPERFRARHPVLRQRFVHESQARPMGSGLLNLFGRRKDGTEFPIEISLSPLETEGGMLVSSAIRDVTERHRLDQLKNEFVSTVSHELRTPLTAIRGALGLLVSGAAGPLPDRSQGLLQIAARNSELLVRLVNDILDFEKIESKRMEFNLERLNAARLVEQAIAANRPYGDHLQVEYRIVRPPDMELPVLGDSGRLIQVMNNLLSNAAKFSPADTVVDVTLEVQAGQVRIGVRDQGDGVPPEFRPRIFQRFAQAEATDDRRRGGTGLGLSIAKAIVEKHRGTIGFDDMPDGGTRFWFTLPLLQGAPAVAVGTA
jgi:PAS domain S-box-containing protein